MDHDNLQVPVQCTDESCDLPCVEGEDTWPITRESGTSFRPFNDWDQYPRVPSQASGGRTSRDQEELRITLAPLQLGEPESQPSQYVVSINEDLGKNTGPASGNDGSSVRSFNDGDQNPSVPSQASGGRTIQDQEELQHLKRERTCKVCLEEGVHMVLIPCGHLVCEECSCKLSSCPYCRGEIWQRFNIYFS